MGLLERINSYIWGVPTLLFILFVGLLLTVRTKFAQFRLFPMACRCFAEKLKPCKDAQGVSPFQALCTALAATVGTGNIAGVAGAISIGGAGAVFWMWVCALLGMVIKCAEAVLAIVFRKVDERGDYIGGPMYIMEMGLGKKWKPVAVLYALFGVIAAFGVGNLTQLNAVLSGIHGVAGQYGYKISQKADVLIAAVIALFVGIFLWGGVKRIGHIAEFLVPYAAVLYVIMGAIVIVLCYDQIDNAFAAILKGAFCPRAVTGGVVGSVLVACKTGASRGIFTNEAGMGTASIAHAASNVRRPLEQGLMGIMEVFIDTIVICTVTALVILCSGVFVPFGTDTGAELTSEAFCGALGSWAGVMVTLCLVCFAFATVIGWGVYGMRCAQYLFGDQILKPFMVMQVITLLMGATLKTDVVWLLAESVNGLMAIPNLLALVKLTPVVAAELKGTALK